MIESGIALAVAGAALAVSLAAVGSAIGLALPGEAAAGLISEEPEKFGKALLLQVLPGTQGIYGFLAAILILQRIGLLGGEAVEVSVSAGWQLFFASLPIAIVGLVSGIFQGRVSAAGISTLARRPEAGGKAVILAAMVETCAVIALLVTILVVAGINL